MHRKPNRFSLSVLSRKNTNNLKNNPKHLIVSAVEVSAEPDGSEQEIMEEPEHPAVTVNCGGTVGSKPCFIALVASSFTNRPVEIGNHY
jgi:hypothetical protein